MKKTLKDYRKIRHLSQQQLADASGVSVRTIQRIEKGGATASPYVIRSLCDALNIDLDAVEIEETDEGAGQQQEQAAIPGESPKRERALKIINFSSVLILLFPLLNIIVPGILYKMLAKGLNDRQGALKILSFQLLWTFATLAAVVLSAFLSNLSGMTEVARYPLFIWVYLAAVGLNLTVVLDTAVRINKSQEILPSIPNIL